MPADYEASYTTLSGTRYTVTVTRGTQVIGNITGSPVNATDFGTVVIEAADPDGDVTVTTFKSADDLTALRHLLRTADHVATSRDEANDRPYPGAL